MKIANGMLSVKDVAEALGTTPNTVRNWCRWWEGYPEDKKPEGVVFPKYVRLGGNQQRMFTIYDVQAFRVFKAQLRNAQVAKAGIMQDFNNGGRKKHGKKH